MIKKNQRLLNLLNVVSDMLLIAFSMVLAYWLRFYVFDGMSGHLSVLYYLKLSFFVAPATVLLYSFFNLYNSFRTRRFLEELPRIFLSNLLAVALLTAAFYVLRLEHFSRLTLVFHFVLSTVFIGGKRLALRLLLRHYRAMGRNLKHVILVGGGENAAQYAAVIHVQRDFGYQLIGYLADTQNLPNAAYLGKFSALESVLQTNNPDEVVAALDAGDYHQMESIIAACEKTGCKLSILPFYSKFLPAHPDIDEVGGLMLINLRRIPLDNLFYAFIKRATDLIGSVLLIVLTSPIMLFAAIGIKCTSPGPVIFRQERVGLNKKPFVMYKFRSMRLNDESTTAWSTDQDPRKTKFGAFLRKFSIDELPQFFNVLFGSMSLVGPRPELPHFVSQFQDSVPLYMVKHQVRPGITGWAQVHGLRGDTSIPARVEHDIWYIEHWTWALDIKILFMTIFKGLVNGESL
ncbi:MAG: undecaprenyl-phosphate glucose phosphotransferase [Oscillospiraceae bacterium]